MSEFANELGRLVNLRQATQLELLANSAEQLSEDAVIFRFDSETVEVFPDNRLLYFPAVPAGLNASSEVFSRADVLEFRMGDHRKAIAELRPLSESKDPEIRALALLRLARNLGKLGDYRTALTTLSDLEKYVAVRVESVPASLLARYGRFDILRRLRDENGTKNEARLLHADLQQGNWSIDRATYRFYKEQIADWVSSEGDGTQLAVAVERLWHEWQGSRESGVPLAGYRSLVVNRGSFLTLSAGSDENLLGLVAGSQHLNSWLVRSVKPLTQDLGVGFQLKDPDGTPVVASIDMADSPTIVLSPQETDLPWALIVGFSNPTQFTDLFQSRQVFIVSGLVLLLTAITLLVYFTARASARELEAARLKSDFVAAVSHEFRTPLTSLRQFTELLVSGRLGDPKDRASCYQVLHQSTARLSRLVENLLDFARVEAGVLEYRKQPIDLNKLAAEVHCSFQLEVERQGYRVTYEASDSPLVVMADQDAISRALWNLLDNAVKYSLEDKTISVSSQRLGPMATIRIKDRGGGIPEAEQKKIFYGFVRGSSSRVSSVRGSGLGLQMVQQIAKDHSGSIELESELGKGSCFTILIPLVD